jgi:hypothetical protein
MCHRRELWFVSLIAFTIRCALSVSVYFFSDNEGDLGPFSVGFVSVIKKIEKRALFFYESCN